MQHSNQIKQRQAVSDFSCELYFHKEKKTMSSNRESFIKSFPELFQIAQSAINENLKCSTIMRKVREYHHESEDFFLAYALLKHGKIDKTTYESVVDEFKAKHQRELKESFDTSFHQQRLWGHKESPLYRSHHAIDQNQNVVESVSGYKHTMSHSRK